MVVLTLGTFASAEITKDIAPSSTPIDVNKNNTQIPTGKWAAGPFRMHNVLGRRAVIVAVLQ